ncbi:MAG: T9SS type A sorting domain-containing protein [Bacteroidales bacterium]
MKKTFTLTMLLIFFALMMQPVSIQAQYVTSSQTIGSGVNQLDISVSVDAGLSQAKFEITGPATVWFGFSFNTTVMSPGSYTILANVSGGNPSEYIMVNHAAPTLQPVQNLTSITSSVAGGRKTFVFYRALSTGDPNDHVFTASAGNLDIAWAYGSTLALGYHASRGGSSLNFINPCSTSPTTTLPTIHICQGDSVQVFGQYKSVTGNYSATYPVSWGCDSIVMQPLVVHSPVTTSLPAVGVCDGDSALIFGQYQVAAGIYSMTYQSVHGCDSTVTQELIVTSGSTSILDTVWVYLCQGDSIQLGGQWINYTLTQPFFDQLFGCDSIFNLYIITAVMIDTAVTATGNSLVAVPGYMFYSWIDCTTQQPAPGSSNSNTYTPPAPGIYQVQITQYSCMVESGCHAAGSIGIGEAGTASYQPVIYPNPASDRIFVGLPDGSNRLKIIDLTGRELLNSMSSGIKTAEIEVSAFNPGIYMLVVNNNDKEYTAKLLIQR